MIKNCKYLVVGGGIAGVSCSTSLSAIETDCKVILLSSSPLIKAVRNIQQVSRSLQTFDVDETSYNKFEQENPGVETIQTQIKSIDYNNKFVKTEQCDIQYEKICICTGASPKSPFPKHPKIITIRDTGSAKELETCIKKSRRVLLVGNGGIGNELAFQVKNCHIVWVIKDKSIGNVFFDAGAAEFFMPLLKKKSEVKDSDEDNIVMKRMTFELDNFKNDSSSTGSALGPDWHRAISLQGAQNNNEVTIEYQSEVASFTDTADSDFPLHVKLTNGKEWDCDLIISATGVTPNTQLVEDFSSECRIDEQSGGVVVDTNMRVVGLNDVYAAGDVCSACQWPPSEHWFQMRLWTQARQMGMFAARCMSHHQASEGSQLMTDICFDVFSHMTSMFGKKLVLLGRYNMQGLGEEELKECEMLLRMTRGEEYVKVVLKRGRMLGAVLIGETDFEETFENLILNGTDLSYLGEELLNPDVDIPDYFD